MEQIKLYSNISELIEEVEQLGDWKDESQRDAYFHILAKLAASYYGYTIDDEHSAYPPHVREAFVSVCAKKFPADSEPFDENGDLKPGLPTYSNYLSLATTKMGHSILAERTSIVEIARDEYGLDILNPVTTKADVHELITSCSEYLIEQQFNTQPKK